MTHDIKRILAPVDFSKCSEASARYAARLAEPLGAAVEVLHVWDPPPYIPVDAIVGVGTDTVGAWAEKSARQALAKFTADLAAHGVKFARSFVRSGAIAATIVDAAESEQYDAIVIGTHGRTGLSHAVLGSVAERVVRLAPCPVITVPEKYAT